MLHWKIQEIHLDYLLLDDTRIPRPFYMSRIQWQEWCENAIQSEGTYQDGYDDCHEQNKHFEYEEKDLEKAENRGYENAISDIRGDIQNYISYEIECIEGLSEEEVERLSDKLLDIVGL